MFKSIAQWIKRQIRRAAIILAIALVIFAAGGYSYYRFAQWQEQLHAADLKNGDVIKVTSIGTNQDFASGPVNYLYATRLRDGRRVNVPAKLVTSELVGTSNPDSYLMLWGDKLVGATIASGSAHAALPPQVDNASVKQKRDDKKVSLLKHAHADEVPFEQN